MWPAHEDSLPSDGVMEHRAIIAPRTPPRERRKDKAAQAEQEAEPAQGKGGAPGDTRLLMRPKGEVSGEGKQARGLLWSLST